jgi:hypothetical protein
VSEWVGGWVGGWVRVDEKQRQLLSDRERQRTV